MPFKRPVYERVVKEFSRLAGYALSCSFSNANGILPRNRMTDRPTARTSASPCSMAEAVLIGRRRDDGPIILRDSNGGCRRAASMPARTAKTVMRELWEETGASRTELLSETDWMTYEFPSLTDHPPTVSPNSAASGRDGSPCATPDATRRSIR